MTNLPKNTKDLNPTLKRVSQLLNEVKFNPRAPGVINIIVNSGNPSYFETRALEFISEAQITRMEMKIGPDENNLLDVFKDIENRYKEELISAIRMLTIAILKVEDGET